MTPPLPDRADEALCQALAAYDEALAAGAVPDPTPVRALPPVDGERFLRLQRLVHRLDRARPRVSPNDSLRALLTTDGGAPITLGAFRLVRCLGQGGFGIVYLARDTRLGRDVALKIPRPEVLLTPELRPRFLREARAAAGLDHPNLVPVYEAGESGPISYLVAAYCPGPSLAAWLRQPHAPVAPRTAAQFVAILAEAVTYMHGRKVFHRDIKPSNVLLVPPPAREHDADAPTDLAAFTPRLTDFGLAKILDDQDALAAGPATASRNALGTPAYMAPEQAEGRLTDIGPPTDVYALGVLLYELLTGQPPFVGSELDVLRRVVHEEPVSPRRLRADVPRDLATICLKCLHKEPGRRYRSGAALAADLRRFLACEPIAARPVTHAERVWRWARRKPGVAALLAVSMLALAGAVAGGIGYLRQRAAHDAQVQRAEFQQRRFAYGTEMAEAGRAWQRADFGQLLSVLNRLRPPPDKPDLDVREFAWHYLWGQCRDQGFCFHGHTEGVTCLAFTPDGRYLVSGSFDDTVRLWDPVRGQGLAVSPQLGRDVTALAITPDGQTLAVGGPRGSIKLWELNSFQELAELTRPGADITALAYSPDGRFLAAPGESKQVRLWDVAGREPVAALEGSSRYFTALAYSPDGRTFAAADRRGNVHLWNADTHTPQHAFLPDTGEVTSLVFLGQGAAVATIGKMGWVTISETASGRRLARVTGPGEGQGLAMDRAGRKLAVAGNAAPGGVGVVKLWDVPEDLSQLADTTRSPRTGVQGFFIHDNSRGTGKASALTTDARGNLYVAGHFHGPVSFAPGRPECTLTAWHTERDQDIFVAKYTAEGAIVWARAFQGWGDDRANGIAVDGAGNVYVTGVFPTVDPGVDFDPGPGTYYLESAGHGDIFVVKLNADGNLVWARRAGSDTYDAGHAVAVDGTGNVYVAGQFRRTADFDPGPAVHALAPRGNPDGFLWKLDREGNLVWVRQLASDRHCIAYAIALDGHGNVYLAGEFISPTDFDPGPGRSILTSSPALADGFVCKLDPGGVLLWAQRMGGRNHDAALAVAVAPAGDIYVTGVFFEEMTFGPVIPNAKLTSQGDQDVFVCRMDAEGRFLWADCFGGRGEDRSTSLAVDGRGTVFITGHFRSEIKFAPQGKTARLESGGDQDGFVAAWDPVGIPFWAARFGGPGRDGGWALALDRAGRLYVAGDSVEVDAGNRAAQPGTPAAAAEAKLALACDGPDAVPAAQILRLGQSGVRSLALSPDGSALALGRGDGVVQLWHPTQRMPDELPVQDKEVWAVAYAPDGRILAAAGDDHQVRLWDPTTRREIRVLRGHESLVSCVAFSPNGRLLASGSFDDQIYLWDPTSGQRLKTLTGHTLDVRCLAFAPDGRLLASGGKDKVVRLWDVATGQAVRQFEGHERMITGLAFTPKGDVLATASEGGSVRLWRVATGETVRVLPSGANVHALALSPDGSTLAWTDKAGSLRVLELATGRELRVLRAHQGEARALAFSPDGRTLATSGDDQVIRLWDPATGSELLALRGHAHYIYGLVFSPDGRALASASHDRSVRLWVAAPD